MGKYRHVVKPFPLYYLIGLWALILWTVRGFLPSANPQGILFESMLLNVVVSGMLVGGAIGFCIMTFLYYKETKKICVDGEPVEVSSDDHRTPILAKVNFKVRLLCMLPVILYAPIHVVITLMLVDG